MNDMLLGLELPSSSYLGLWESKNLSDSQVPCQDFLGQLQSRVHTAKPYVQNMYICIYLYICLSVYTVSPC